MEWKLGIVPRARFRADQGSPQALRTSYSSQMMEVDAAMRGLPPPAQAQDVPESKPPLAPSPPPEPCDEPDVSPQTAHLHRSVMDKLTAVLARPRACPMRTCRRHRRCASSRLECASLPGGNISPEAGDAALANLQRALRRRSAALSSVEAK